MVVFAHLAPPARRVAETLEALTADGVTVAPLDRAHVTTAVTRLAVVAWSQGGPEETVSASAVVYVQSI